MTYCISDIHGCFEEFMTLMDNINFSPEDTVYVLGDVVDRGKNVVKCYEYIMNHDNIHMLMGNHEQMLLECLVNRTGCERWNRNGSEMTMGELNRLQKDEKEKIIRFIKTLPYYFIVEVRGKRFLLVHAGLNMVYMNENEDKSLITRLNDHDKSEIVWIRDQFYKKKALGEIGITTIFGHTTTTSIDSAAAGSIWMDQTYRDKICIDCGCVYGGKLAVLRLDDMAVFYTDSRAKE